MKKHLYRVSWISKITGFKGHGFWLGGFSVIKKITDDANKRHLYVHHFVQRKK